MKETQAKNMELRLCDPSSAKNGCKAVTEKEILREYHNVVAAARKLDLNTNRLFEGFLISGKPSGLLRWDTFKCVDVLIQQRNLPAQE